ncbi:MAG: hypothetical protein HZA93_17610 [Verrucomicrobia bacterium]|nr:hypothetical protein [Verrucomicrobiota bacterium]
MLTVTSVNNCRLCREKSTRPNKDFPGLGGFIGMLDWLEQDQNGDPPRNLRVPQDLAFFRHAGVLGETRPAADRWDWSRARRLLVPQC